jgi:hypothetical protein
MTSKAVTLAPSSIDTIHDNRRCTVVSAVGVSAQRGKVDAATRTIASILGVLVGMASIEHGVLECLQGRRPIPGLIVNALGQGYSWTVWKQGGEGAITLLPNFLLSGIVATLLGMLMIVWALRFLSSRHSPIVFLTLGVTSFLFGGGVAQVVLFTLTWGVATRIHAPLAFWERLIRGKLGRILAPVWPWTMAVSTALFLVALEIAVFGYVLGIRDQTELLHTCWKVLALALALFLISVCSGFACDVEARCSARFPAHEP